MTIGQTIYLKPIGNAARGGNKELIEAKITKIGRKYFELDKNWYGRFFIDSLLQDGGEYISNYQGYLSREAYEEELELRELEEKLNRFFRISPSVTLTQAREVVKILGI